MGIVVNLFGVPGSGKSTGAAYIFSQLKMAGVNVEIVTEFAKDKVYEESKAVFENQAYIFGKQYFRITRCIDKVDVVITDSPILLSSFYHTDKNDILGNKFDDLVLDVFNKHDNINYYIERVKPYNPIGRFQNESESDALNPVMLNFLLDNKVDYATVKGNKDGYDEIVSDILFIIECRKEAMN